jgi:hypothetical protein
MHTNIVVFYMSLFGSASALSLYVDHTLVKSVQDISTLRSYMYNFKSL